VTASVPAVSRGGLRAATEGGRYVPLRAATEGGPYRYQ
jgi:hypothetical protein